MGKYGFEIFPAGGWIVVELFPNDLEIGATMYFVSHWWDRVGGRFDGVRRVDYGIAHVAAA